jgi:hypothetical protein
MFGHNEVQSRLPLSAPKLGIFTTFVLPLVGESCDCVSNTGTWEQPAGKRSIGGGRHHIDFHLVSLLGSPQLDNTGDIVADTTRDLHLGGSSGPVHPADRLLVTNAPRKVVPETDRENAETRLSQGPYAVDIDLALRVNLASLGKEPFGSQDEILGLEVRIQQRILDNGILGNEAEDQPKLLHACPRVHFKAV